MGEDGGGDGQAAAAGGAGRGAAGQLGDGGGQAGAVVGDLDPDAVAESAVRIVIDAPPCSIALATTLLVACARRSASAWTTAVPDAGRERQRRPVGRGDVLPGADLAGQQRVQVDLGDARPGGVLQRERRAAQLQLQRGDRQGRDLAAARRAVQREVRGRSGPRTSWATNAARSRRARATSGRGASPAR